MVIFIAEVTLLEFRLINNKKGMFKYLANITLTDYPKQQLVKVDHFNFHKHFSDAISDDNGLAPRLAGLFLGTDWKFNEHILFMGGWE